MAERNHPFEENTPTTMWAEESVIAEDILKEFSKSSQKSNIYISIS